MSGQELTMIGQSPLRVDAREKVTGQALFTADFPFRGCYARLLLSPHAHARIIKIDTSRAEKVRGVRAVITGEDPLNKRQGLTFEDQPLMAMGVVRHVGEVVAAVVADTLEIAEEALDLIDVDYELLPAVFDPEEALKPDCPVVIHPDILQYHRSPMEGKLCPDGRKNVYQYWEGVKGDVEKAFREADFIVENRFSTPRQDHACLETHAVDAWPEPDGGITVRCKVKAAYNLKSHIVKLFGISPAKVKIIVPYVGGDFGSSGGPYPHSTVAMLALRCQRPVRLVLSRRDNFLVAPHKPPQIVYVKDGIKNGEIIAREVTSITDGGAYTAASNLVTYVSAIGEGAQGIYKFPNLKYHGYGVYTNLPPGSAFRGIGQPDLNWALESQMDIVASRLGVDPVEFRQRYLLHEGDRTNLGHVIHSIGVRECLIQSAKQLEWGQKPEPAKSPWKRGKGVAVGCMATPADPPAFAYARVHADGVIEIRHTAIEQGQGTDTVMSQIAAEAFGIPLEKVIIAAKDTSITIFGPRTGGCRSTFFVGNAVLRACEDARRQVLELAAPRFKVAPEMLDIKNNKIFIKDKPENYINISKLFTSSGFIPKVGEILGKGECSVRTTPPDEQGHSERSCAYYDYGAYCVQIAVDEETGEVRLEKVAGCFDMGRPMHPKQCEQQIEGAISMASGIAIFEQIITDKGVVMNPNFHDYKMPSPENMPETKNIAELIGAVPHREGPFGAKGLGEVVLAPFYAAIGNAFYNATGVRIKDLPFTMENVLKSLKESGGKL